MKRNPYCFFLLLLGFIQTGVTWSQNSNKSEWRPLFGNNLSEAEYDRNCWKMEGDVLTASEDKVIWAKGIYENFVLNLEFKTENGTNSGVIVYCTDRENWIPYSVEIQIADDYSDKWGKERKDYQCGAIFGHLPAVEQKVVNKPGEWNKLQITCKGQNIDVELNGKLVTQMDMRKWTSGKTNPDGSSIPEWLPNPLAQLPTKGAVGLQGKHADASVWFRNIMVRAL
ncbi:MAG: DUF1080 domain-containing protein [Bacteroidales bacterium]|nr:DUF1080 domain-containing protein [Bacteroidales bacterium]